MTVRTRIEPSPSGSIHVGNAYAALFNWLWARKHDGVFILRIADTDRNRVTEEGIRSALEDFRWLGLEWDEGPEVGGPHAPYFQSERTALYREAVARLVDDGHAYTCYCTADELEERRALARAEGRPPGYDGRCRTLSEAERTAFETDGRMPAVRFQMPEGETRLPDIIRGEIVWDHANLSDFVIARADGTPLYMLAAAYDDMVMGLTHVVRADEHLSNTPKQIALITALGGDAPAYAHLPLVVGADRKKLSKRHGATAVAAYRAMGILPEVLLNYLAILSWSVGDGVTERFTVPELIAAFDLADVTRNASAFDQQKLEALNGERIRELGSDDFAARVEAFVTEHDGFEATEANVETLRAVAPHIQERMKRLDETWPQIRFLFGEVTPDGRAAKLLTSERAPLLEQAAGILEKVEPWTAAAINEALMTWADGTGVKRKDALQPLRAAVTGSTVSPPLFESIEVLGRERAVGRLRAAAARAEGS